MKGDMYIRDLKNTKGHISGLTWGEWHPRAKETVLTSSEDGSLRIWDVNDFKSQKQVSCLKSFKKCYTIQKVAILFAFLVIMFLVFMPSYTARSL